MITPHILLKAYASGIFPMAENASDNALYWIEPDHRGILPLAEFHIPRSLIKRMRQKPYQLRIDHDFDAVIEGCAESKPGRTTTWINKRIKTLYSQLFKMGNCHTIECWQDGVLVGGLYGVRIGGAFFGESMFSRETDASKIALSHLVARLRFGGFQLLDTQFITDHLSRFGAIEMLKEDYQIKLIKALEVDGDFHLFNNDDDPEAVIGEITRR